MIEELTKKMLDELEAKKDKAIRDRITELGIDINLYENLMKRRALRFNPFILENHGMEYQLLYYNDGSTNGLFIIRFKYPTGLEPIDYSDLSYKISASIQSFTVEPEWNKIKT